MARIGHSPEQIIPAAPRGGDPAVERHVSGGQHQADHSDGADGLPLARLGVTTMFIEPGSPWENGYNESFMARFVGSCFRVKSLIRC